MQKLSVKLVLVWCVCLLFSGGENGYAAKLLIKEGRLVGAEGVKVEGAYYDVKFAVGTFPEIFPHEENNYNFTFTSRNSARKAAYALLDQVFIDTDEYKFDTEPELTCDNNLGCTIITPYFAENYKGSIIFRVVTATNDTTEWDSNEIKEKSYWKYKQAELKHMVAVWKKSNVTSP